MNGQLSIPQSLRATAPQTFASLELLTLAAVDAVNTIGKKTIFGRDKHQASIKRYEPLLVKTLDAMRGDKLITYLSKDAEVVSKLMWFVNEVRVADPTIEYGCIFIANHLATEDGDKIVRFCQEADYAFHNPLINRKKSSKPAVAVRGPSEKSASTSPQCKPAGSSQLPNSKKSREVRSDFKEEFETTIKKIHAADDVIQLAIGVGINLAFSVFRQKFPTPQAFRELNTNEQLSYLENLTQMEDRLRVEQGDVATSMGFWLFKAWVGTLVANDHKLERQCFAELSRFSQMAEGDAR